MKILVLFDIDGTILSLKHGISRNIFCKHTSELFGCDINIETISDFSGKTDLQILNEMAQSIDINIHDFNDRIPDLWEKMTFEFSEYCNKDNISLMPGVEELINYLVDDENFTIALLTGNFKANAYLKLNVFNLGRHFRFGAFGCDREDRNQLPKIAIKRANEYNKNKIFSSKNTIIIGDSIRDIKCAKKNNIPVIAVLTGGLPSDNLIKLQPEYLFEDLSDYKKVKNQILNHFITLS